MKLKHIVIGFCSLLAVSMAFFVFKRLNLSTSAPPVSSSPKRAALSKAVSNQVENISSQNQDWWTNRYARKEGSRNATVDFWGRVIDENGAAVPGAHVKVGIRKWRGMQAIGPEATYKNLTLKTGVDGEFSLLDEIGDSVEVSVSKEGYFLPKPQQLNFGYGRPFDFVPDKENPQIFVLMSSAAEKSSNAVSFKFRSKLPAEHGVRSFDIVRNMSLGQPDAAHITLFFERDPPLLENGDKDFNWTLRIKVNDGGVIVVDESAKSRFDTKTSFMHEAPEDGYLSIIERSFRAGMDQWKSSEVITFYFRTGNNFGKDVLEINAGSSANEVPVNLLGVLNLDGSRRLGGN